jgi:hypothetical protein
MAKDKNKATAAAAPSGPAQDFRSRMPAGALGEEIDSGDVDFIVKFEAGDELTGRYRGFKKTRSSKPGEQSTLHKFESYDGEAIGVWGSYQLDAKLAKVVEGAWVWIQYLGKQQMASGNTMHEFRVVPVTMPTDSTPLPVGRAGTDEVPF